MKQQWNAVRLTAGVILAGALTSAVAARAAAEPARKPSVLICRWGSHWNYDRAYVQRLQAAGFVIDVTESWAEVNWERIAKFDAIMLFNLPEPGVVKTDPGGGPASGMAQDEFLQLLDRYTEAGGGVFLNISHISYYAPGQYTALVRGLARLGLKLPAEAVVPPATDVAASARLRGVEMYYTSNVLTSPVSAGVQGLWIPVGNLGGHLRPFTGPFELDASWQSVVRAPKGSTTQAFDLSSASDAVRERNVYVRAPTPEADLFAIRPYKRGRLAVFYCDPVFHLGSGTKWFYDGAMLDKGVGGRPSHFARLFENTLRWLAEPAQALGQLGGAQVDPLRLVPPSLRPGAKDGITEPQRTRPTMSRDLHAFLDLVPTFQGFVGAQTTLSGGRSTVAEYAQVARERGLGFVIVLEDGAAMTAAKMEELKQACTAASDKDLLVIPGFRFRTNLGGGVFVYGANPVLPATDVLSKRVPGAVALQAENPDGSFKADGTWHQYVFGNWGHNDRGWYVAQNLGYYDFRREAANGGFLPEYTRVCGAIGLVFYRDGQLVEDVTPEYLRLNAGTLSVTPMVINEVNSAAAMRASLERGDAATYAQGPTAAGLLDGPLRWYSSYDALPVFVSSGPMIDSWPDILRVWVYGAEDFVNDLSLFPSDLRVRSAAGLREITIYDGERLVRRFLPGGAPEFKERLFLSGELQQTLTVMAEDVNGKRAVASPRRCYKEGTATAIFCSDHVNDCGYGNKLARGPCWPIYFLAALIADAGGTWDGGPVPVNDLLPFNRQMFGSCVLSNGVSDPGFAYQYPVLSLADGRVFRGGSVATGKLMLVHANPWSAHGPVAPREVFGGSAFATHFGQYSRGVDPDAYGVPRLPGGTLTTLYEETMEFVTNGVVSSLVFGGSWMGNLAGRAMLVTGQGDRVLNAIDISPRPEIGTIEAVVPQDGWYAMVSPGEVNARLTFTRGGPVKITITKDLRTLSAVLPPGGAPVRKGETWPVEFRTLSWPLDIPVTDAAQVLRVIRYLTGLSQRDLLSGRVIDAAHGLLDVAVEKGQMELTLSTPPTTGPDALPEFSIPLRVSGLNPRWSAGLFQVKGFNGASYYSDGSNRYRPLGMDERGRVYTPLDVFKAPTTHVRIGHPVTADAAGKDLFIQVTALTDPRPDRAPQWHLSVNNPTDKPVRSTLTNTMKLPGLQFKSRRITLPPGGFVVLEHGDQAVAQRSGL